MDNVKTWKCFPTSVHEAKMNISDHDQMMMRSYVQKVNQTHYKKVKDDTLHKISYFRPLTDSIKEVTKKILEDGGYEFEEVEMTNMWGNLLKKGATHPPHTHSNNTLSGVYYLKGGSPIQFFDPRPAANILKPRNTPNWDNSGMIQFNSVVDTSFIFPSWLMHWVPSTPNERISIAWNILVRGHYGEPHTLQNAYI